LRLYEPLVEVGVRPMDLFQRTDMKLSPVRKLTPRRERDIQRLLEANLQTVFGIRFLVSEYSTGERHGGRIDTLGMDENHAPVIVEYKLTSSVNVVTQGLSYLAWLTDHKGDFEVLVHKCLGADVHVDWTEPRVLCVAESFAAQDASAVSQVGPMVQLVEFKIFEGGLLLVHTLGSRSSRKTSRGVIPPVHYSIQGLLERAKGPVRGMADELRAYLLELGDEVSEAPTREYIAFRTTRNFCCLEVHQEHLLLHLTLDPQLAEGCPICTDVTDIGHFGTGDLRVRVRGADDLPIARQFIDLAYGELKD